MKANALFCSAVGCCIAFAAVGAADVVLVEDGAAKCCIVVADDAHPALKFGAREIAKYLGVATDAKVEVSAAAAGLLPVSVRLAKGGEAAALKEDGFTIDAAPGGVEVIGANPRGALYGCYDILKKYAGMRWVFPGEDGEYCVLRGKSVRVPLGRRTVNPYLKLRKTDADGEDSWLWLARNNMTSDTGSRRFTDKKTGKPSALSARLEELCVKGTACHGNSHIMMDMMCGWAGRETRAKMDALFAEHPEYFPLVGGKRIPIYNAGNPNPCVSNSDLLDLMAENLYKHISVPHGADYCITIGNNDTTAWCECEKCKALDAPELAGTKGQRADRYWYAVTEIARRVWAKDPSLNLGGWAYQDFWYPPARVKIDPKLTARISFNNQCYRHAVDDPDCSVNSEWCKIYSAWAKTGLPLVVNRDEIGCEGSVGSSYAPSEGVLRKNFLAYPKYGCAGSHFCVYAPFQYMSVAKKAPYFGRADRWHGMWQTCYMSARMMWNPAEVDFDAELEEACRLFYGEAAWKAGMKEFRALLTEAWLATPGCYGWGLGSPLGRCLDKAGVEDRLVELMNKSVAAAEASGDERAIAHMRRERDVFELTWIAARKRYLESFKELNVYRKTGEIKIDGVLDEADWKNADALGDFRPGGHTKRDVKVVQSSVRVVYDQEDLYISVECLLPDAKDMVARKDPFPADSEARWKHLGEHVELFYNYPDMAEKYYHICVNPYGLVVPAKHDSLAVRDESFRTRAKIATKVLDDRWVLEMAIPTSEIGMKCFDGATWKLNVGRSRHAKSLPRPETSSCCNGAFHGAANFVNIKFVPTRGKGLHQNRPVSSWSNAGFEDAMPNSKVSRYYRWSQLTFPDGDDLVPRIWYGGNLRGKYMKEGGNRFMRLLPGKGGYLSQYYVSDAPGKVRISFRIRGKGKVALWTCLFTDNPTGGKGYAQQKGTAMHQLFDACPEWTTFTVDREKRGLKTERMSVRFTPAKDSEIDLDDVVVSPME